MTFVWTQEKTDEAKRLYIVLGWSAGRVAAAIGAPSRNAVIGKAHRSGWQEQRSPEVTRQNISEGRRAGGVGAPAVKRDTAAGGVVQAVKGKIDAAQAQAPTMKLRQVDTASRLLRLLDLEPHMCRYPIDDPGRGRMDETLFCAADKDLEATYCEPHAKLCGGPAKGPPAFMPTADRRRFNGRNFGGGRKGMVFAE